MVSVRYQLGSCAVSHTCSGHWLGQVGGTQCCEKSLDPPQFADRVDSVFVERFDESLFLGLLVGIVRRHCVELNDQSFQRFCGMRCNAREKAGQWK